MLTMQRQCCCTHGASVGRQHQQLQVQRGLTQNRQGQRRAQLQTVCVGTASEANFEQEVLSSDVPVLCDFWATWCGPCKLVEKPLANLEKEFDGRLKVVKIEADPNPSLVEKYKVYGLPTFVLFKDGKVIDGSQKEGAIAEKQLRAYLEQHKVI